MSLWTLYQPIAPPEKEDNNQDALLKNALRMEVKIRYRTGINSVV